MNKFNDILIFGDKSLSDLFKQIHKNNKDTDKQINELIDALKPLASSNAGSAVMLMPTVKDLIDVNVKNNEQLIKMAGIVQRATTTTSDSSDTMDFFNSDEIQKLVEEQKAIQDEGNKLLEQSTTIQHQIENK
jgi:methyl-accepting chemotaxis protein